MQEGCKTVPTWCFLAVGAYFWAKHAKKTLPAPMLTTTQLDHWSFQLPTLVLSALSTGDNSW